MFARGPVSCALVASLVLFVAGCSGGARVSAPTAAHTGTTAPSPTTVSEPRIDANLAYCPPKVPTVSLKAVNAEVPRLATKLVPIAALRARVCQYSSASSFVGGGVLLPPLTGQFEALTNDLEAVAAPRGPIGCPRGYPVFLLTFANDTHVVFVVEAGCGRGVTNGARNGRPTEQWLGEARIFTSAAVIPLRRFRALFIRY